MSVFHFPAEAVSWAVYALVAIAALACFAVVWRMATEAGLAEGERRDMDRATVADGRQKTPLERFVSPGRYFRLRLGWAALPAAGAAAAFLAAGFAHPWVVGLFTAALAAAGWNAPRIWFARKIRKRMAAFESRILDLASGLAGAMKSGMAFPQALDRLSVRMDGPMGEELATVLREYRLGLEMPEALERLAERMPCEDMRLLAASVKLTGRTGGSLADVLDEMAGTIRSRREFADKVRSLTAQGRFEGAFLGFMPVVAFVIFHAIHPDMMKMLYTTATGWCAIGVVALLETVGFWFISKITDVEA